MSERLIHFDMDLWDAYGESYEIVNDDDAKLLFDFVGEELYLGEISGKHSEVTRTLKRDCFDIITIDSDKIEVFREIFGEYTGAFNIINAIKDQMEDDEL